MLSVRSLALVVCAATALLSPARASFPRLALKPISLNQVHSPTTITNAGDGSGRLFVCDQPGRIYVIENGALLPTPFLDLSAANGGPAVAQNTGYSERGLLGLAFHPGFGNVASPGYRKFYVNYNKDYVAGVDPAPPVADHTPNCVTVIAEFQVSAGNPNVADALSERRLLVFPQPQSNHNGGQLEFGPDGMLYIGTGDGGSSNDNNVGHTGGSGARPNDALGNAQDKTVFLGKILRIDPIDPDGAGAATYSIPADNPFASDATPGLKKEIYAYGLRNPWRFSFDKRAGGTNRLFCGDVGQGRIEEINLIVAGGNYGWRYLEGEEQPIFSSGATTNPMPHPGGTLIAPIATYAHVGVVTGTPPLPQLGLSVTGGFVYRGAAIPPLRGKYVFGDYGSTGGASDGRMMGLEETAPGSGVFTLTRALPLLGTNPIVGQRILTLGENEGGEIFVGLKSTAGVLNLDTNGQPAGGIYQIVAEQRITTTVEASQDNTIYSEDVPLSTSLSDGQGYLYVGRTGTRNGPYTRRALVAFDLMGVVPADAVLRSAQLQLDFLQGGASASGQTLTLQRLTETWGEGASFNASGGGGAPAETDDATWLYRFFDTSQWSTPGGSFSATNSATATVSNPGPVTWASTSQLIADVQSWLDTPASNAGWIIRGNEGLNNSACQFASVQSGDSPPRLVIGYDTANPPIVLTVPADIVFEATSAGAQVVAFTATAADSNGDPIAVTAVPASGSTFPFGITTVNLSASDASGNTATGSFTVTVQDKTKPTLMLPSPITAEATSPSGAVVTFNVSATDAVSTPNVVVVPPSGSTFAVGVNTVNVTATDAANNQATGSFSVTVQDTTPPMLSGPFRNRTTSSETVPDFTVQAVTSDIVGVSSVTQTPTPGGALALGPTLITITASDAAGNDTSVSFTLTRLAALPPHTVRQRSGDPGPGAGSPGGVPSGAVFTSFGVPAINDAGAIAFLAKWSSPTSAGAGIFAGNPAVLVAKTGDPATGAAPATFKSFADPVLDSDGHVAFLATLAGVPKNADTVLATNAFGGTLSVAAREGSPLTVTGAPRIKSFRDISLVGGEVLFTATLTGGTPAARSTNDDAAFRITGSGLTPVVREGDSLGASAVKAFKLLSVVAGSPGQNRGHNVGTATFIVLLADRTQALVDSAGGVLTDFVATGDATGGTVLPTATFKSFGPVATDTTNRAFLATLNVGVGGVTAADARAVFFGSALAFDPVAREAKPAADLSGVVFKSFLDPALAPGTDSLAFPAKLKGPGVKGTNDAALFYRPEGGALRSIAREGDLPPGTPVGTKWKSFVSLALPAGDIGPVFHATMSGSGVKTSNDAGVWAVDTTGQLRLLFREGITIDGQMVKTFAVLNAVRGSSGVTRAFNNTSLVVWRADFANHTSAIVVSSVP